jgi:DNA-binding ferritin-like protein (Dps family)
VNFSHIPKFEILGCDMATANDAVEHAKNAINTKVNSHLNQEYLGHMVDVSVASKYGTDLTQFTQVMAKDMRNTFDTLKQDLNASLPRQVRALVHRLKVRLKENE